MGKPKEAEKALVGTDYNWGEFGGANKSGVSLSPTASRTVSDTQAGIGQYLNEIINPSVSNTSFMARQNFSDSNNMAYAEALAKDAMAKGYRGTVLENTLNSLRANRANEINQNLIDESARIQDILSALSGVEGNYFNQSDIMRSNILQRQQSNQGIAQDINKLNNAGYNTWKSNMLSGGAGIAGTLAGAYGTARDNFYDNAIYDSQGNYMGQKGGYGTDNIPWYY